jgi:hypothetical protein
MTTQVKREDLAPGCDHYKTHLKSSNLNFWKMYRAFTIWSKKTCR